MRRDYVVCRVPDPGDVEAVTHVRHGMRSRRFQDPHVLPSRRGDGGHSLRQLEGEKSISHHPRSSTKRNLGH